MKDILEWELLKQQGSEHYKTGGVEAIDLYRAYGVFKPFALCSIVKYATRNFGKNPISQSDLDKIIDYAKRLKACG